MIKFSEHMLLEAFSPKKVEFGTDYKNSEFKISNLGDMTLYTTFFVHEDVKIKFIYYSDGMFAYGIFSEESKQWKLKPSSSDYHFKNMIGLYSELMYILFELLKQVPSIKIISYTPSEYKLESVYSKLFTNKSIINQMKEIGFEQKYENKDGENIYHFIRK